MAPGIGASESLGSAPWIRYGGDALPGPSEPKECAKDRAFLCSGWIFWNLLMSILSEGDRNGMFLPHPELQVVM